MVNRLEIIANENLNARFIDNPCRGIVLGVNEKWEFVQLCWIMGRGDNSKNRVYVINEEEGSVRTEPADPSKVKNKDDLNLIIYNAMRNTATGGQVVSNGVQTDTICKVREQTRDCIGEFSSFQSALREHYCEPDPIIFTPRISGVQYGEVYMSILKADPYAKETWIKTVETSGLKREDFKSNEEFNEAIGKECGLDHKMFPTIRQFFELPARPGFGYCLTTYKPGSKTLPSFEGEPFVVPLKGPVEEIMQTFWNHLEPEWRVALAGKIRIKNEIYIPPPINRFEKVQSK